MAYALVVAFSVLAAFIAGIAIGMIYKEAKHMGERIAALEAAQVKHLPYRAAEEIEDATAAILRIKFETDFRQEVIDNALEHLQMARTGKK